MRIAVASGKGGTGKTLVATSLALTARERGAAALLDADVEAPNAALFLQPVLDRQRPVELMVPVVDQALCNHCGRCAEVCQFHAIASLPKTTLVFGELCHGCGSCALNCPTEAIAEVPRPIGLIEAGWADGWDGDEYIRFAQGTLEVGEAMATPVIRALKGYAHEARWGDGGALILDAPPGTACPVIEALRGGDVALLVTEPTPFGLHDLRLAVEVARDELGLPVGVVINRDGVGDQGVESYCAEEGIPILMRIPLDRRIAEVYSEGGTLVEAVPEYRERLWSLYVAIGQLLTDQ